jgi:uncharacterized membrane-anchored protein
VTRAPSASVRFPEVTMAFWISRVSVTIPGEIVGQMLNQMYLHRSGRVIVATLLCFIATLMLRRGTRALLQVTFWSAVFWMSILSAVLAEAIDTSMGVGDIGAILLIAILLVFSFLISYRMTRTISAPADSPSNEAFFWATAALAQTFGSASADWIIDPGGPGCGRALIAITLGILATIGLYAYTRISRAVLFWIAFTLSGTGAALGGHIIANSFVAT